MKAQEQDFHVCILEWAVNYNKNTLVFFTFRKRFEVSSSLLHLRSTMFNCFSAYWLRSSEDLPCSTCKPIKLISTSVDTESRGHEMIFFIQMYNLSDGTEFRSVSTYWRPTSQVAHRPTLKVWVNIFHLLPNMDLSSYRVAVVTPGSMCVIPLLWHLVGLEILEQRKFSPLWALLLSINCCCFPGQVWLYRVKILFKICIPESHIITQIL